MTIRSLIATLSFLVLFVNPLEGQEAGFQKNRKDIYSANGKSLLAGSKLPEIAKRIGLEGEWIVSSVEKDGEFSKAKIGQQINDVISIFPEAEEFGHLVLG